MRPAFDPFADRPYVGHGPHLEDPGQVDARQRRANRGRTGRKHQLVVALRRHLAGRDVAQVDRLLPRPRPRSPRNRFARRSRSAYERTPRSPRSGSIPARSRREMWYGRPQFAYDMYGPRSTMTISAFSSRLRRRAAHDAPPATPPMMMTFMFRPSSCGRDTDPIQCSVGAVVGTSIAHARAAVSRRRQAGRITSLLLPAPR